LYRVIDADGNLVDSRLSEKRDMEAAQQFFKQVLAVVGHVPEQVTTDGHASYPRAVRETVGGHVQHRTSKYLNNRLEQDHRGIKQRYYPMHGFGSFDSAARFCSAFDELRHYLRPYPTMGKPSSLSEQRRAFFARLAALKTSIQEAI
jgi:transposase-like protein